LVAKTKSFVVPGLQMIDLFIVVILLTDAVIRNQVIKQMLYEKEHEINAERRMVAAKDAARLKKRISPVEYARNQNDPDQVSRQEKDYIERYRVGFILLFVLLILQDLCHL
jgi:thioesterase domain-containing protein